MEHWFNRAKSPGWYEQEKERKTTRHLAGALHLKVDSPDLVHELFTALVLSEVVYKQLEEEIHLIVSTVHEKLPWKVSGNKIRELQFSSHWASQRCVVTQSGGTLFVCFRGTKARRDIWTDLNVFLERALDDDPEAEVSKSRREKFLTPCAHRGFLFRAKAVPITWFYRLAKERGLRLVFCGHSLGGAVATLATVRLLHHLQKCGKENTGITCIAFGSPAVGNPALRKFVKKQHWNAHIYNYTLKEDFVPVLLQPQRFLRWRSNATTDTSKIEVPRGNTDDSEQKRNPGYIRKFTNRITRLAPIIGRNQGNANEDLKGASAYTYIGQQLTVLDGKIIPASLKQAAIKEYNKKVEEEEGKKGWNLLRAAFQSFEAHRMYTYRDRIFSACSLENQSDPHPSSPLSFSSSVLPGIDLNFGIVRVSFSAGDQANGKVAIRVFLAGRNIASCTSFQMKVLGELKDAEKVHSVPLDKNKVARWIRHRFPEKSGFWDKALMSSKEIFEVALNLHMRTGVSYKKLLESPLNITCRSDFQLVKTSLVLVPTFVHISSKNYWSAKLICSLLLRQQESEVSKTSSDKIQLNPEVTHYSLMDYSFLSDRMKSIKNILIRSPSVAESNSDVVLYVDCMSKWRVSMPNVMQTVKTGLQEGTLSILLLLNDIETLATELGSQILVRAKEFGFARVYFMSKECSSLILGSSHLSPATLYRHMFTTSYTSLLHQLEQNEHIIREMDSLGFTLADMISCTLNKF